MEYVFQISEDSPFLDVPLEIEIFLKWKPPAFLNTIKHWHAKVGVGRVVCLGANNKRVDRVWRI
jgi:hypothetical protein